MSEKIKADIYAARKTICSAISDWTQTEYKYGDPIPTFVNGSFTGLLKDSLMTRNERIEKIVRPVILTTPSTNCPSSYIKGHYSGLSIGGSGSFV